jgi:hypothetical protein
MYGIGSETGKTHYLLLLFAVAAASISIFAAPRFPSAPRPTLELD